MRRLQACIPGAGHFSTEFKPNHRWSCVSSVLSWVRTLKFQTFPRSPPVPKCLVAEVFGNLQYIPICTSLFIRTSDRMKKKKIHKQYWKHTKAKQKEHIHIYTHTDMDYWTWQVNCHRGRFNKKLSYCLETARRESLPLIAEIRIT